MKLLHGNSAVSLLFLSSFHGTLGAKHHDKVEKGTMEKKAPRIINGSDAPLNEYNWYAMLANLDGSWHGCGGTLVTPEFVVSAAHCGVPDGVKVGALCEPYEEGDNCGQDVEMILTKEGFMHPRYDDRFSNANDFLLIQLETQSTIDPVPMDEGSVSSSYLGGEPLWAIGIGAIEDPINIEPDHLQHVEIDYVDQDICQDFIYDGFKLTDDMMCAGPITYDIREGGCYGDSGGPLYDKESNTLVGVVSWKSGDDGDYCGDTPTIFARIGNQWPWIRKTICENHSEISMPEFCEDLVPTSAPTFQICNDDELTAAVSVFTDNYPYETYWEITTRTGDVIVSSSYGADYELFEHQYCFPLDECFIFSMVDTYGDGINYPGGYNFTVDGVILATSVDGFSSTESVLFGTCVPTPSPSNQPTATESASPSFTPCEDSDLTTVVSLLTDSYPEEISWYIFDVETGDEIVSTSYSSLSEYELFNYQYCFPRDSCYMFQMIDSYGDGILSPGGFNFSVSDDLLASSDDVGYFSEVSVKFGEACPPTPSPTVSEEPSLAPSPGSEEPSSVPSSENWDNFLIASDYDSSLCVETKQVEIGSKLRLRECDKYSDKQQFHLHGIYGQLSLSAEPALCLTKYGTSQIKLDRCQMSPGESQKWAYDSLFSKDLMIREKGFRVLSTKNKSSPANGTILRVLHKDHSLVNGAQGWKLIRT